MTFSTWTEADSVKAQQIWLQYQQAHDLSQEVGKTAGIEPKSGRVWIGDSIDDVIRQRNAEGTTDLLFFERIGSTTYFRKGGRR